MITKLMARDGKNQGCKFAFLSQDSATIFLQHWFDEEHNKQARQSLEEFIVQHKGSDLAKDAELSLHDLGPGLFEGLRDVLGMIANNSVWKDYFYYLAYTEQRNQLHMFVLYLYDQDMPTTITVSLMSIAYPGVFQATFGRGGKLRPPMADLFRQSLEHMRHNVILDLNTIRVRLASKGSELVVIRVFCLDKLDESKKDDAEDYTLMIPDNLCCQICDAFSASLSFDHHRSGAFCSANCAAIQWKLWGH